MLLHHGDGLRGERGAADRLRIAGHEIARDERADVGRALEAAAQVAVGDDAEQLARGVDHGRHAEPLAGDLGDRVAQRRALRHARHLLAAMHEVVDTQQAAAERSRGMQEREVVGREAALLEQRHRERVAERHRDGRAGRRRQAERTGLFRYADVERDVGRAAERRGRVAGDGDIGTPNRRTTGRSRSTLAFAAVRERDQHVAARDIPTSPWLPSAACRKNGRRPGRGERRSDLAADEARLADAGDDDLALAREQQVEGARRTRRRAGRARAASAAPSRSSTRRARRRRLGHHARLPPYVDRGELRQQRRHVGERKAGRAVGSARDGILVHLHEDGVAPAATAARASGAHEARSPPDACPARRAAARCAWRRTRPGSPSRRARGARACRTRGCCSRTRSRAR